MRYPIYIFFLMSGFFYLTGNPFTDNEPNTAETGVEGKVAQLKYGRRVSTTSSIDKTAETQAKTADAKTSSGAAKSSVVAVPSKSAKVLDAKMQPSAVASTQQPTVAASPSKGSSLDAKSFAAGKANQFKDAGRKPLDWTVFGNKRKNASLALPVRTRSQDEIDAQGIEGEPATTRSFDPRKLASNKRKYKRARLKRKRLTARRAARKARKAKKARRLARLKRRSKGVYRIARKAKKKSAKKKRVANKPRRKKFGFSQSPDQTRLSY